MSKWVCHTKVFTLREHSCSTIIKVFRISVGTLWRRLILSLLKSPKKAKSVSSAFEATYALFQFENIHTSFHLNDILIYYILAYLSKCITH